MKGITPYTHWNSYYPGLSYFEGPWTEDDSRTRQAIGSGLLQTLRDRGEALVFLKLLYFEQFRSYQMQMWKWENVRDEKPVIARSGMNLPSERR